MRKHFSFILLIFLLLFLAFSVQASRYIEPTLEFNLIYEIAKPAGGIDQQEIILCEDKDCLEEIPKEGGLPLLSCYPDDKCRAFPVGSAKYIKIKLNFSDKTRESNIFESGEFHELEQGGLTSYTSYYTVVVKESELVVAKANPPFSIDPLTGFFISQLFAVLLLKIVIAFGFLWFYKISIFKKFLLSVAVAAFIVFAVLFFIFPSIIPYDFNPLIALTIALIFAIAFETAFIYVLNKETLPLKKVLILSVIMNIVAFIFGGEFYIVLGVQSLL
ncbi:MAG: hypothetical protein ABIJ74_01135 [archaeon]